jgi:hypothetical protein
MTRSKHDVKMEKITYAGWKNCLRLTNGTIELVATTDVGPRIIRLGTVNGQNFMCEFKEQLGKTGGNDWLIYGGHRLWHAPEAAPRTYYPDNEPVACEFDGQRLILRQPVEKTTGIRKEIEISFNGERDISVLHRLINTNLWDIETAPWSLSVLAAGGRAIVPQEEFRPHPEYLLPARPLVLWHYTNMADRRWTWGQKYIQLQQDPHATTKQKVGLLNKQGWAAYALGGQLFVKKYGCVSRPYPDLGCNTELFTNTEMLELETLGPLVKLAANAAAEHTENWSVFDVQVGRDESEIDAKVLPLVRS